jgi:hypothetical protein
MNTRSAQYAILGAHSRSADDEARESVHTGLDSALIRVKIIMKIRRLIEKYNNDGCRNHGGEHAGRVFPKAGE